MLLERLGRFSEAAQEYGEALPLLRAAGRPVFECLFNRGYCYKWVRMGTRGCGACMARQR